MLTRLQIRNIRIFMQKATLTGAEVPAYADAWNALDAADKALELGAANVPTTDKQSPAEPA